MRTLEKKIFWRQILVLALILVFMISACGVLKGASPPRDNGSPDGKTWLPAASATSAGFPDGALIPITGENVVFMQCQFCVGDETHVVLIFPDTAYFDVDRSSPTTCLAAEVVNGRRIVICRGPQETSFILSVCSDPSNCLQFPVALQPCDLLRGSVTTFPPVILTPLKKGNPDDSEPPPPARTAAPPPITNPPANPSEPTTEPKPTKKPKPTKEPKPTKKPKPTKPPKSTKAPKPTKNKH